LRNIKRMTEIENAIQAYMRPAASQGRTVEQVGPFLATFSEHTDLTFLNYAIPDDNAQPAPQEVASLIAAYQWRQRIARLEYIPALNPAVLPPLLAAGFEVEGEYPIMVYNREASQNVCAPAGIELVKASTDDELMATLVAQFDAYGQEEAPTAEDVQRLRESLEAGAVIVLARDSETGTPAGGGVCLPPFGGVSELAGIGVRPAFQRRGIAAAVTALLAQEMAAVGTSVIFLTPGHDEAERVYQRVGFETVSKILHISKS